MKPNLILHNANIYTVDSANPWAEAIACANGTIVAVGRDADILPLADAQTELIDGAGKLVLPGLIDSHAHFLQYAVRRHQVNLFGVRDFAEVCRLVQNAVETAPEGHWVQGWGWDENLWEVEPTAAHLDAIAPNTPVVLARMDMHTWWANSAAMRQANITAETPDPPESLIERDAQGHPNGLFREWSAIDLVARHLPEPDDDTLVQWLREAIAEANQLGLTSVHDQRVEWEGQQSWQLWQTLRRDGTLTLRVHANIAADYLSQLNTLGFQAGFGDDRLWMGHAKLFADGSLGSKTALMLDPFENEPDNVGIVVTPTETLADLARQAQTARFPLSVHAIGDKAVREVIDVLGQYPSTSLIPHRIEHVQVIHPDDLPRLKRHNLVASVQPVHIMTDWATADKHWGERSQYTYAFRSLLNHQTRLAFGSDAPVAPLNPLLGIYAAVTRQDDRHQPPNGWQPQEILTMNEAIYGYTMEPARLAGKAEQQGSITPGKWADFIMLSDNLFEIDPHDIPHVAIRLTVFNGQVVHHNR